MKLRLASIIIAILFFSPLFAEKSFLWAPGKVTVQEAIDCGYSIVRSSSWPPEKTEPDPDEFFNLRGGGYPLAAKNGIVEEILFYMRDGVSPPQEISSTWIDPDSSPEELLTNLQMAGYECRQYGTPWIVAPDECATDDPKISSEWELFASMKRNPNIVFKFCFKMNSFWSYTNRCSCTIAAAISPDRFNKVPLVIPSRRAQPKEGTGKDRALDLSVVLSVQNETRYDELVPLHPGMTETDPEEWKGPFLKSSWNIDSRESYLSTFDDMVAEGHSKSYRDDMQLIDRNPEASILQLALYSNYSSYQCDRLFYVKNTREWLGERSLRAWDLARMIMVTRWAYATGYITEDEAWERILPIAKILYEIYGSREDFLVSYIGGRGFWGAENPWKYMSEALETIGEEFALTDSRQHLPWDSDDTEVPTRGWRMAKLADLSYIVTDEQKEARATYEKINELAASAQKNAEEKHYDEALSDWAATRKILASQRIGNFYPSTYYQILYSEGLIHFEQGNLGEARKAFLEVLEAYPDDENLKQLINSCDQTIPKA